MNSVNRLNILKILQLVYEQHFQLSNFPSEFDKILKTLIKDFLDIQVDQAGSSVSAIGEDLQYALPVGVMTFDELEKFAAAANLLNGHNEGDFEAAPDDRLTEPASTGTEPSSHELYVPRISNPKATPSQAADLAYKKRAVAHWMNVCSKKHRSLSSVRVMFPKATSIRQLRDWRRQIEEGS